MCLFEGSSPWELVQNTATDFAQLKTALSKAFPAIHNRKVLEIRFYASQQRRVLEPTDFVYDLLKLHTTLKLGMTEERLVYHFFVRLEPQIQDYVEAMRDSRNSDAVKRRGWDNRRMSNTDGNRKNWRHSEVVRRPRISRIDYRVTTRMAFKEI
ncbi:uncharacterized protein TNCV_654941 [Trichonephila clavipes]|nr:uncharacterized protein TNCV_654941 [Trichonephila clavipes]